MTWSIDLPIGVYNQSVENEIHLYSHHRILLVKRRADFELNGSTILSAVLVGPMHMNDVATVIRNHMIMIANFTIQGW